MAPEVIEEEEVIEVIEKVVVKPEEKLCTENGTCFQADKAAKIPVLNALFQYFDIDGSGGASEEELLFAFEDVDENVDGRIDSKEMFKATIPVFKKLC